MKLNVFCWLFNHLAHATLATWDCLPAERAQVLNEVNNFERLDHVAATGQRRSKRSYQKSFDFGEAAARGPAPALSGFAFKPTGPAAAEAAAERGGCGRGCGRCRDTNAASQQRSALRRGSSCFAQTPQATEQPEKTQTPKY